MWSSSPGESFHGDRKLGFAGGQERWVSTKTARAFREELQPMSGALYDERAYKLVR